MPTQTYSNRINLFLLWIFIASGLAGLIYQSIWAQYLGLILGHSAYAQTLVLALFMGGMALGAWLVSRRSTAFKKPLMAYATVELAIGILGVVFHVCFQSISNFAYTTFFPMLPAGIGLELGRWLLAGLLIFPQCVLLGMTFPLMSAGYIRLQPHASGRVLAGLYFANSLGAATGALASTYVLLPSVGLPGTVLTAGLINIMVALAMWPLAKTEQPAVPLLEHADGEPHSVPTLILWAAAITGATSFVYEISWVRMLSMTLGSTIHAFELMLAAFIAGIAFGGWWLRGRADQLKSPRAAAGWAQIAMGGAALSTLFLYNYSFEWVAWLMQTLNRASESGYAVYNFASAVISMIIMFPTAFFAGMTLPLLTLILLRQGGGEGSIGRVYATNTLGAIVGVALAVYIGLPVLGLRLSLWLAAAADIVLGLVLLAGVWRFTEKSLWGKRAAATFAFAAMLLLIPLLGTRFDPLLMSSGVFRHGSLNEIGAQVLYYKDGRTASVALRETGDKKTRSIVTNGKPDAAIATSDNEQVMPDEVTMMSLAVIPMLFNPEAEKIGIIGFGSGMSTHFVLGNPQVKTVDTIEIEPAMVEAAQYFGEQVTRAFHDQRSRIIIDDAKSYFSTNRERYDIIISEPSNPWVNGVASLFTEEFYKFIPRHLTDKGIFVQWLHTYEISPQLVASVLKAMLPYFSDVQLFQGSGGDWVLVASPTQSLQSLEDLRIPEIWSPQMREEMTRRGIGDERDVFSAYLGNKEVLQAFTKMFPGVPENSDFFPVLQLGAPKARFQGEGVNLLSLLKKSAWPVLETITRWKPTSIESFERSLKKGPYISQIEKAHAIRQGLLDGVIPTSLGFLDALMIEQIRQIGADCSLVKNKTKWLYSLTQLAADTIPYLSPEDLEGVWIRPSWLHCVAANDTLLSNYLAFIEASAARSNTLILSRGQDLFETKETLLTDEYKEVGAYVLGGMELAAYALKKYSSVEELEKTYGGKVNSDQVRKFIEVLAKRPEVE